MGQSNKLELRKIALSPGKAGVVGVLHESSKLWSIIFCLVALLMGGEWCGLPRHGRLG
ncbi:hypothetical protein IPL68_02705 [Candidatus Saccharibacteria bacterium]|nr:MAG: hypothetical protein IPL68_02705 [Candidatus Saccharibacteria bacterium]